MRLYLIKLVIQDNIYIEKQCDILSLRFLEFSFDLKKPYPSLHQTPNTSKNVVTVEESDSVQITFS